MEGVDRLHSLHSPCSRALTSATFVSTFRSPLARSSIKCQQWIQAKFHELPNLPQGSAKIGASLWLYMEQLLLLLVCISQTGKSPTQKYHIMEKSLMMKEICRTGIVNMRVKGLKSGENM